MYIPLLTKLEGVCVGEALAGKKVPAVVYQSCSTLKGAACCLTTGQMLLLLEFKKIFCSYSTNHFGAHKSELFFAQCFDAFPIAFVNPCGICSVSDVAGFCTKG